MNELCTPAFKLQHSSFTQHGLWMSFCVTFHACFVVYLSEMTPVFIPAHAEPYQTGVLLLLVSVPMV